MGFVEDLKAQGVFGNSPRSAIAPSFSSSSSGSSDVGRNRFGFLPGGSIESFVNLMRNRDLNDIQTQLRFYREDDAIRQNGVRDLSGPTGIPNKSIGGPRNEIYIPSISDYQRATLGLEERKLNQQGRIGEEKQDLANQRLALDQLKNKQIFETKNEDLERRIADSDKRLQLAYDQLQARRDDAGAMAEYRQAQIDATNARHEAQMAQRDRELDETKRLNEAKIKEIYDAIENAGYSISETELDETDPLRRRRTVVTRRGGRQPGRDVELSNPDGQIDPRITGAQSGSVEMTGPDGEIYFIPKEKVAEAQKPPYNMKRKAK